MNTIEFKIPEIGENIHSGTVTRIAVSQGQTVNKGQDLLELETDKATVPIPSPVDGKVEEILIKEGAQIKVGQVVMKIATEVPLAKEPQPSPKEEKTKMAAPASLTKTDAKAQQAPTASSQPVHPSSGPINLVVVGGGPGGYAAAFLAADLGMNVTLVDKEKNPGGVCLFRG
ncbi:MAG: biotin/lipoyl-binding protein, partial [Candidatus Omnitrophica bacterium]|nr:biotin/lipoyl-binding protein [Candidatus Omnitrophota bacterium]